jgi:predicted NBD/HSP70 family sugar kinase
VIVGVEVREHAIRTIAADHDGTIVSRDERPISADAVRAALRAVATDRVTAFGIAGRSAVVPALKEFAGAATAGDGCEPRFFTAGAAVAAGEQWRGAARRARHVIAIVADERIDAGIIIDGRVFHGAHGAAGAAGWLALNPVERDDYRRLGCLQAEVAGPGIVRRLLWRVKGGDSSQAVELAGGSLDTVAARHVFEAARKGDAVARGVVRDTARYFGMAIANLATVLDPQVIVLSGLMADAADLLLAPCRAEAQRHLPPAIATTVEIVAGKLGPDAAALGAARAAMLAQ